MQIAENEKAVREAPANTPSGLLAMVANAIPALRDRADDYQRDYEHFVRQTDDRSLETVRRFIRNVQDRERWGDNPAFGFLFGGQ